MSDRVIGLDIGSSAIKAAQVLRRGDGSFVVEKQHAMPLPRGAVFDGNIDDRDADVVANAIRDLVREARFDTKDVIFGLNSSSAVTMQEISIPSQGMQPEDLDKALPLLVVSENPNLIPEENELAYTVVGETVNEFGAPQLRVIVYSVRADFARRISEVVENAGLTVVGADLSVLSALRAVQLNQRHPHELDAIVDIGASITSIFLHHNGVPKMLVLDPDSAGNAATARIAEAVGGDDNALDHAEYQKKANDDRQGPVAQARNKYTLTLATKIAKTLENYLERTSEFDQIANLTLIGGGGHMNGLGYFLNQELGSVPLSRAGLSPDINIASLDLLSVPSEISGGDFYVAVGLGTGMRI